MTGTPLERAGFFSRQNGAENMSTCFVSHASSDAVFAQFVTQRLRSAGVPTFLAPMGIEPGARWSDAIRCDMEPSELPSWIAETQAVDLRGRKPVEVISVINQLARKLERQQLVNCLLLVGFVGLMIACSKSG